AEDGIRDFHVTGVQTCALPISGSGASSSWRDITRPLRGRRAGLTFATSSLSHAHWCPWWGDSLAREDARPGGYDPPGFFLWAGSWGGRYRWAGHPVQIPRRSPIKSAVARP